MLWLVIATIYTAAIGALDIVYNIYGVSKLGVDPVTLGFLGAEWLVVYILTSRIFTYVADRGKVKLVLFSAIVSLLISLTIFAMCDSIAMLALSYALLSMALAGSRMATTTAIFETMDSSLWSDATNFNTLLSYCSQGILLAFISWIGFSKLYTNIFTVFVVYILVSLIVFAVVPEPSLPIERSLYLAEKTVKRAISGLRAVAALESGYNPKRFSSSLYQSVRVELLLLALAVFVLANEIALTPLPYYLHKKFNTDPSLAIYGISIAFATVISAILISITSPSSRVAILFAASRALMLYILVFALNSFLSTIGTLLMLYALHVAYDITIYGMYVENTGGYRMHLYYISTEIGGVVGSLISGFIAESLGYTNAITLASLLTLITIVPVVRSVKKL